MKKKAMVKARKARTYRLSENCIGMIEKLARDQGISQSAVIELAVRGEVKRYKRGLK